MTATAPFTPKLASTQVLAQVQSSLPDGMWLATGVSREALESFAVSVQQSAPGALDVLVTAAAHNAMVAQLAALSDELSNPSEPYRLLASDPTVPVVGLGTRVEIAGLSAADDAYRRELLAALRGALLALRPTRTAAAGVPAAGFPWPLVVGAAVVVVIAGIGAFAAYRGQVDSTKIIETAKTARAAQHLATRAALTRERYAELRRTGRLPPPSPLELEAPAPETSAQVRTWADTAAEQVTRATTTLVIGGVVITVVAGTAVVLSRVLGGGRRRYVEI